MREGVEMADFAVRPVPKATGNELVWNSNVRRGGEREENRKK